MKKTFIWLLCLVGLVFSAKVAAQPSGETRMFTITGYYSPLPTQPYFLTGSYASEIRLNGHGKTSADGTPVFPGMIAAPSSYEFGTKLCIPKFGCGTIHDRGGAIVEAGKRNLAKHDRLDLWLGYGEAGLRRALAWGVQQVPVEVFDKHAPIKNTVNFSVPLPLHEILDFPAFPHFSKNLASGDTGELVRALQQALQKFPFFTGSINGQYDTATKQAVQAFQLKYFVIATPHELGAGRFGPKTRQRFSETYYQMLIQAQVEQAWTKFSFETDQGRGKRNADIVKLQQLLIQEELLTVYPTGFFGPLTEKALIAFQLKHGIIHSPNQSGAGTLGPKTRQTLNTFLQTITTKKSLEKKTVLAYQRVKNQFAHLAKKDPTAVLAWR